MLSKNDEKIEEIKNAIRKILEQEVKDVSILNIEISNSTDNEDIFEDEDFLYVTVVLKLSGFFDNKIAVSFVRLLQPKLSEINEERFPVISFVSHEDYEGNIYDTARSHRNVTKASRRQERQAEPI